MKRFQVRHIAALSFVLAMMIPSSYAYASKEDSAGAPFLLPSAVPGTKEWKFLALFPLADGKMLGLDMVCPDQEASRKLLAIDGKQVKKPQARAAYIKEKGDTLILLDDKSVVLHCPESKDPKSTPKASFKPYLHKDLTRFLLEINTATHTFVSVPTKCDGLRTGLNLAELMKPYRAADLLVSDDQLTMQTEYRLHCGTSTVQKPATASWQLVYTQQYEIFASYGTGEDRTALQIKSVDMQKATDIVMAWLDAPVTEEQKASAKKVKELFGGAAPIGVASASQILGVVPDLQLDLCATSCGTDTFKPEHMFQGRKVEERSVTATRALDSTPIAQWFYAGPDTSLNFMDCGEQSVSLLLGLQQDSRDWSLAKTDEEWIAGVRVLQAKSLSKPIACLKAAEHVCVKTISSETRDSRMKRKKLFSATDCQPQARTLEIRLEKDLILDESITDLTLKAIRAGLPKSKLETIRLIGRREGVRIRHALSCPSAHIVCPTKPEQTVPGFRVSGPMTLILDNLKLERTGTSQSSQFSGIEAVDGSQLILNAVTISSDDKAQAFAVGIRAQKAKLYLNNSNVFAATMSIDAQESRALINADAEELYQLSPSNKDAAVQFPEFRANLNLSGPRSAAFIINQVLAGTTSLKTGGLARVESQAVHYKALTPSKGRESTLLRDLNGHAVVEIVDGKVDKYNKLAYLDQDGTKLMVVLPKSFKLSDCVPSSDNPGQSLAYDPRHHLGGVQQLVSEHIKVRLRDNECSQASENQ